MTDRLIRYPSFASEWVEARPVDLWLPPGYDEGDHRYPVLYMHDGQNLFDPALSFSGLAWGIDDVAAKLIDQHQIRASVVVGIWNTKQRVQEYMPQQPLEAAPSHVADRFAETFGGAPISDAYLRFIVLELKPFVDAAYRTQPEPAHTFIMGSSMGGLIALYALCEYPHCFGGAGCLSTSWTVAGPIMPPYLRRALPEPATHTLYFDYGSEAQLAAYESYQKQVDRIVLAAGYRRERNWTTRRYPGAAHSEQAWHDRLDEPLRFLLPCLDD